MLEFQRLTKYYSSNAPAIDDLSFDVHDGEIVGFVGLNGAGKTTTIRIAAGVSLPTEGTVRVDGRDVVKEKAAASRSIGWVPEFPNVEPNAKALDLMLYFAGFHGITGGEARRRSEELLSTVRLGESEGKRIRTFSQGMKKRFSLALALLSDPKNLVFDEILNGLDPEGIHYMRELTAELRKGGRAVLLSSHILAEIENLSDRVVFIHKGKIVESLTTEELRSQGSAEGVLRVGIANLDENALSYLRSFGETRVEVANTVAITRFAGDPASVNAELVSRGYAVKELSYQRSSLEDYFLKLVGVTGAGGDSQQ